MKTQTLAWLALQLVGEMRDDVEDLHRSCDEADATRPSVRLDPGPSGVEDADKSSSSGGSSYLTTGTGRLFPNIVGPSVDPPADRRALEKLGVQEHWLIPKDAICIQGVVLGSSAAWTSMRGDWHGTPVAVKLPQFERDSSLRLIKNELRMLRQIRHPCIATFHGASFDPASNSMALVLEFVRGPTLDAWARGHLPRRTTSSEDTSLPIHEHRYQVLLQICQGLRHLQERKPPIMHGNLKGTNILVEGFQSWPRPKITDFALSQIATTSQRGVRGGEWRFQAPEVLCGEAHRPTPRIDMFAYGGLVLLVETGLKPYAGVDRDDVQLRTCLDRYEDPGWGSQRPATDSMRVISEACLRYQPRDRPVAAQVQAALEMCDRAVIEREEAIQPSDKDDLASSEDGTSDEDPAGDEDLASDGGLDDDDDNEARANSLAVAREIAGGSDTALGRATADSWRRDVRRTRRWIRRRQRAIAAAWFPGGRPHGFPVATP